MEAKSKVSLVSKSFWYSFICYYTNFLKRCSNKAIKFSTSVVFSYGFDFLLIAGKIYFKFYYLL